MNMTKNSGRFRAVFIFLLAAAMAACASSCLSPSAISPASEEISAGKAPLPDSLRRVWEAPLMADGIRNIYCQGNMLLVEEQYNRLAALDLEKGKLLWTRIERGGLLRAPFVSADQVYYFTTDQRLVCLADGGNTLRLDKRTPVGVATDPFLVGDKLVAATTKSCVAGIGVESAWAEWSTQFDAYVVGTCLQDADCVGALDADGNLFGISPRDGHRIWVATFAKPPVTAPAPSPKAILVGGADAFIYAYDPRGGTQLWRAAVGAPAKAPPVYAHGKVFCQLLSGEVVALDASTGAVVWRVENATRLLTATAARAYVIMNNDSLVCLSLASGALQGQLDLRAYPFRCAEPESGRFSLADNRGNVVLIADVSTLSKLGSAP